MNAAEKAIKQYDDYVFNMVGRVGFNADKADILASVAAIECAEAARSANEPQWMRDRFRAQAAEFAAICA